MEHGAATGWLAAIEHSGLGATLRGSLWLFPAVETLHIVGFAVLVGSISVFDLKVLAKGVGDRTAVLTARTGFALAAPMGLLLFVAEAGAYAANPLFRLKLALIALALVNVAWFHARAERGSGMRLAAGLSLASWLAVLVCGRMIAYV